MADRRYINYTRSMFKKWKNKALVHIPYFVQEFYKIEGYIPYEKHCLLGKVILGLNDPVYAVLNEDGKRLSAEDEITMQIILEIQVENLFSFISKHKRKATGTIPLPSDYRCMNSLSVIKSDGKTESLKPNT